MLNQIPKFLLLTLLTFPFFFAPRIYANHIPAPTGYVNDFAGVLTADQKASLENSLRVFEQKNSNEIAIALVQSLNGDSIENFTLKTFEEWKIGKKGKDNGVLFLASINDRKMRIEVGYGAEPYLTDGEAGEIIRNVISPKFKQQDYYGGINSGINAIEKELSGSPAFSHTSFSIATLLSRIFGDVKLLFYSLFLIWIIASFLIYLSSFLARSKSIWLGGLIGAIIGSAIGLTIGRWTIGIASIAILVSLGLLLDWILSRTYKKLKAGGHQTGWWTTGGGFFGSRGSGVGFGGFGGGSSGGGGASGSW